MQEKYEHFRRQAQDCIEASSQARDMGIKADWLLLAAKWLEMIPVDVQGEDEEFGGMEQPRRSDQGHRRSSH